MANYDFSKDATTAAATDPSFPSFVHNEPLTAQEQEQSSTPPWIHIPNIHNFRAIGTHENLPPSSSSTATTTTDSSSNPPLRVRQDLVFRSAEPSPITAEGITALSKLGIRTVFDLRSPSEIERNKASTPVTLIPGTTRVFAPVFGPASPNDHMRRMNYYGEEGTAGFVKAYDEIADVGRDAYRTVFTHIRDHPTQPLLVHCTAGKDRTGIVVALILSLVGVSDDVVGDEYALTETGLVKWLPHVVAVIMRDPALGGDEVKVRRMVSAKKANMLAFLASLRHKWGGAEGYLRDALGFDDTDIATIRKNITEPM